MHSPARYRVALLSLVCCPDHRASDGVRAQTAQKTATAIENHPNVIVRASDILSIKKLPGCRDGGGKKTVAKARSLSSHVSFACRVLLCVVVCWVCACFPLTLHPRV